jgi:bifunctional UDP-N-acetylglucosamine pyrophosphorylase / glucosamine-1-phosphate N-acetyltransferase
MRQLAVVVLAAGAGTRMRSKTPKVLHEIAGMPILGHVLATAHSLGAEQIITVLRHEREAIETYIHSHFPRTVIAEQDAIAGTGRAVEVALAALPKGFDGDLVVLSGDVPLLDVASVTELIEIHRAADNSATLLSTHLDNPHGYGRVVRARQELVGIVEEADANDQVRAITEVNAGVYVFKTSQLASAITEISSDNAQGEKYLTDVPGWLLARGEKVAAHGISDRWLVAGINDRVQLSEVASELNARIVRGWQLAGVTVSEPGSTWIDITVQLAEDVTLLPGTRLHGLTRVGADSIIGPDTTVVDSEIGAQVSVARSMVTDSRVSDGASVGPFSHLRAGTEMARGSKVGAFVETKHVRIGENAKLPHLIYAGDASIGANSNIGAGTIFANYDGVKKHRTEIGEAVRIGSANVLVAPIEVADGAYTAAGTIVRKPVGPGELAMNPKPQQNLAGWVLERRPGTPAAEAAKRKLEK